MAPKIEVVTEQVRLAEGPHWEPKNQSLYYVDIVGQLINKYTPSTNTHTKVFIEGGPVSVFVPVDGSTDRFLVSISRKLAVVTWDGVSDKPSHIETLLEIENEPDLLGNRWNDGKADPVGRLWAGTMGGDTKMGTTEPEKGAFYSLIGKREVKKHFSRVSISNGLTWDTTLKKMYYIDSPTRTVDQFDYDQCKGIISNRKVVFNLDDHCIAGVPDGTTIDTDGNLWVAVFHGSRILHIDPRTSKLLQNIEFPCKQITSLVFGGPNFDELYVTSARLITNGIEEPKPAGCVFKVTGTGTRGIPNYNVYLDDFK